MSNAWSILSGLGTGLLNVGFSGISSSRQSKYAIRAMNHQDYLNRQFTRDSYGLMREGLEKAGYNPLLALGGSANTASYSGSASATDSDIGSEAVNSALDALRLKNETKLNKSQLKLNDSQSDLNTQQTYKTYADELKSRAEANVASATEAKIFNDINWDNVLKDAEFKKILAETKYTNERSRGFSASSSKSYSGGAFGIKGSYSQGNSKSW